MEQTPSLHRLFNYKNFSTFKFHVAGQTWLLTILRLIANADLIERDEEIPKEELGEIPFLEAEFPNPRNSYIPIKGADALAALTTEPRVIKTHLPLDLLKENIDKLPNMKIIQTIRNPKDTLISMYHMLRMTKNLGSFNGTWDDFFSMVTSSRGPGSDLFEFTLAWYNYNKNRKNSLVLIYEEMKEDLRSHVVKIASFLGRKLSDKVIDYITEKTTFQNMANDPKYNREDVPIFDKSKSKFLRKGTVGDWVGYMSDEQSAYVDAKYKELFVPAGLLLKFQL